MKNYLIAIICSILIGVGFLNIAIVNGFDPYNFANAPDHIVVEVPIPAPVHVVHPKPPPKFSYKALDCLTRNLYFEARGESHEGMVLVGLVVMQRKKSPHFPNTVCGVVYQSFTDVHGNVIQDRCQFSWYCDGNSDKLNFKNRHVKYEWERARYVALGVLTHQFKEKDIDMRGVVNYHASYVDPYWAHSKNFVLVATVGNHMFYRWKNAGIPKYHHDDGSDSVKLN